MVFKLKLICIENLVPQIHSADNSTKPPSKIFPKFIINKYNAGKAGLVYFLFKAILLCLVKYILYYTVYLL